MGKIAVREVTLDDIDDLAVVHREIEVEEDPHRPPIGPAEMASLAFEFQQILPQRVWLAHLDGRPAGWGMRRLPTLTDSHQAELRIAVSPEHRRHGVASALASVALVDLPAERTTLYATAEPGVGADWCTRLGLSVRLVVRESLLHVSSCDLDDLRSWLAPAKAIGGGYRLASWRGPIPDELLPAVCEADDAMSDAPMDDLDHELPTVTPDLIRDDERARRGRVEMFGAVALTADGGAAGFTELGVNIHRPTFGFQGDTVVLGPHRGHRLGRWLKAANLLQALEVHPGLERLTTANAESNPWMLAINDDMGYRPHRTLDLLQGPTAGVVDHLRSRGESVLA